MLLESSPSPPRKESDVSPSKNKKKIYTFYQGKISVDNIKISGTWSMNKA